MLLPQEPQLKSMSNVFNRYSVALVTPFTEALSDDQEQYVDEASLEKVITFVAAELKQTAALANDNMIVGGIIVAGTTGEQHSMSIEEREKLYKLSIKLGKKSNVRVACGVAASYTAGAIKLARAAVLAGCDGILLGLPPYIRPLEEELLSYVTAVCSPPEVPVLLYNNTTRCATGDTLRPESIVDLHKRGVIWGVKHATSPDRFIPDAVEMMRLSDGTIRLYTGSDAKIADLMKPYPSSLIDSTSNTNIFSEILKSSMMEGIDISIQNCTYNSLFYGLTSIIGNLLPLEMSNIMYKLCCQYKNCNNAITNTTNDHSNNNNTDLLLFQQGLKQHAQLCPLITEILTGCTVPVGLKYAMKYASSATIKDNIVAVPSTTSTIHAHHQPMTIAIPSGGFARLPLGTLAISKRGHIRQMIDDYFSQKTGQK